jgi:DNA-binding SARP family transcriptional activator/WD40 repeat protein/tRNA A-37 threonylcarbamoyl transferase component Bud32
MHIRVLGAIDVETSGGFAPIGGPQQRRLLAVLLLHRGRAVSTDRLVDALWPDGDPPDGATRSIRTYVSRLRVAMPGISLTPRDAGYRLDLRDADVDADRFDAVLDRAQRELPDQALGSYEEAIALWRGSPFGEHGSEWWALPETNRLTERYLVAREARAATLMELGHPERALPDLQHLVPEFPLREAPVRLLMEAMRVSGRRAEALRVARSFRSRLVDETGLDPSREFVALESAIAADVNPEASPGRPVRGYVLDEVIGEGAHGRVYAATQPGTSRRVAMKVIRPELADSIEFVLRFETEAQLVARLEHPHIVPLYDAWREAGGAYLVMRLLGGGTLADSLVVGGPWSLDRVDRLVEEIGGALVWAHAADVVHRDVKASNVLLDDDGASYLGDFGIATVTVPRHDGDHGAAVTDADTVAASVRDDVRAFGWMVWETLGGDTSGSEDATRSGHPSPLIDRVPAAPAGLDAVLDAATRAHGGYESVAEFLLAWRSMLGRHDRVSATSDERRLVDSARRATARRLEGAAAAGVNPYRGLRPFSEVDCDNFFGRDDVVEHLLDLVASHDVTTVVGASGSGKSSLVLAGLVPALRRHGDAIVVMVPGNDPVGALATELLELATVDDLADAGSGAGPAARSDLYPLLRRLGTRRGRVVVVVDQFEECWTRAEDGPREEFLRLIADLVADETVDARIVTTVRADLLDRPLSDATLGPRIGEGSCVLAPLAATALLLAVTSPAARAGVRFDDAVVADLVAEATASPGALPLLQFALTELYDRRTDGVIGIDALVGLGGLTGAVGQRAESVYAGLDDVGRAAARSLFSRLVTPGNAMPDTRRRAHRSELSDQMTAVAGEFVSARLLVADRDPSTREPTVEVAHEALLSRWPRLAGWIEEDRRWLELVQHLATAARTWDEQGRSEAELYRGARLESALEAVDRSDDRRRELTGLEHEYLDNGRRLRDAEIVAARTTARRLRRRLTAVAIALVMVLITGAVAMIQRRSAVDAADAARVAELAAEVDALVGRADAIRSTQRDVAALLAVEAHRLAETPRTRSSLLNTVAGDGGYLDTNWLRDADGTIPTDPVSSAEEQAPFVEKSWSGELLWTPEEPVELVRNGIVLPDGEHAVVSDGDGVARPYDLETGVLGDPLPADHDPADVVNGGIFTATPESDRVIHLVPDASRGGHMVHVYDVDQLTEVIAPFPAGGYVGTAGVSADGSTLFLSALADGAVTAFDLSSGTRRGQLPFEGPADRFNFGFGVGLAPLGRDQMVVGSANGLVRVVDVATLAVVSTVDAGPDVTHDLAAVGAVRSVVGAGPAGLVRIDVAPDGAGRVGWHEPAPESCWHLAVAVEVDEVYCGDYYGTISVHRLRTGVLETTLDGQNGNTGSLWPARNGTEIVSFATHEPVVARWRRDGSGPVTTVMESGSTTGPFSPDAELMVALAPRFEGRRLNLAFGFDPSVIDAADGGTVSDLDDLALPMWAPDGAIAAGQVRGGVPTWVRYDLAAGEVVEVGEPLVDVPTALPSIDPGKERMLVPYGPDRDRKELRAVDLRTMRHVGPTIEVDGFTWATISPTGDRIVVATRSGVITFDGETGKELARLPADDMRIAFITAGGQLFVGALGGELIQRDLDSLQPIRSFDGSRGAVQEIFGTSDGSLIAVRGGDGVTRLFDVATGIRIGPAFPMGPGDLRFMALALDGSALAYGGGQREPARVVDLDAASWVTASCRIAGRNLTPEEWDTYIGDLAPYRVTCPE